jgi:hypothetical protein
MAHGQEKTKLAEGVGTKEHADIPRQLERDYAQA